MLSASASPTLARHAGRSAPAAPELQPDLQASLRADPADPADARPPPTCYEDLPAELLLLIAEASMWQNRVTTAGNAVPAFAALNTRLAAVHAAPLAASTAMQALLAANHGMAFEAALRPLEHVPRQYHGLCAEAAWEAVARRSQGRPIAQAEASLMRLLDSAAARAAVSPPLWQRAVGLLLRRRDADPSPEFARVLLLHLAAAPACDISPPTWRRMVQLVGRAAAGTGLEADFFATPGLAPAQETDLALMLACGNPDPQRGDTAAVQALVRRVEAEVSPGCRWVVLEMLQMFLPSGAPADDPAAQETLREALLRVPAADREAALRALPVLPTSACRRQLLLAETARLAPAAAVRVLTHHMTDFAWRADGRLLFIERCTGLAQQSRPDAASHHRLLHEIARASTARGDPPLGGGLAALVLEECVWHEAPERVAVLARLDPTVLPAGAWREGWDEGLRGIEALLEAASPTTAGRLVQALLPGLQVHEQQSAVLRLLHRALALLPPNALALALSAVVSACGRSPEDFENEDFGLLLALCTGLPFYLREGPLESMRRLASISPECYWQLQTLRHDTAEAARQAALPTPRLPAS